MNSIAQILRLRLLIFTRAVAEGGWRATVLFSIIILATVYCIKLLSESYPIQFNLAICGLLLFIDRTRKDAPFLFLLRQYGKKLRFIEYSFIILFSNLYAVSLSTSNFLYMGGVIFFALIVVLLPDQKHHIKIPDVIKSLTLLLPKQLYELKYGLRQLSIIIIPFWIGSLVLSFYGPALPFFILIISIFFLDHISYREPVEITQSHQTMAKALNHRIIILLRAIIVFFGPQLVISLYLWYSLYFIMMLIVSFWIAFSIISYALLLRYTSINRMHNSLSKNIQLLLFLPSTIFPPISIYLLYKQYTLAKCSLKPLLK